MGCVLDVVRVLYSIKRGNVEKVGYIPTLTSRKSVLGGLGTMYVTNHEVGIYVPIPKRAPCH